MGGALSGERSVSLYGRSLVWWKESSHGEKSSLWWEESSLWWEHSPQWEESSLVPFRLWLPPSPFPCPSHHNLEPCPAIPGTVPMAINIPVNTATCEVMQPMIGKHPWASGQSSRTQLMGGGVDVVLSSLTSPCQWALDTVRWSDTTR